MQKRISTRLALTVDNKLRITAWNSAFEQIYKGLLANPKSLHYSTVMPVVYKSGEDAVKLVIKYGKPLTLNNHQLFSLCDKARADIQISPLKDKNGRVSSAKITLRPRLNCETYRDVEQDRFTEIGKVAATLAHGVRNPLNAIKGAVIYLREKYSREKKLTEFTQIIEDEISRLDQFIANFLSTSLVDKALHKADLNAILKKIAIMISLAAQSHGIEAVFKYGNISPVMMNPFYFEHAILNIINNALEAMPSGGRLRVRSIPVVRSNCEFALIEVSDSGGGMPEGISRTAPAASKSKGKGLGLFITREILRSSGGHLEIKSRKGIGTTVQLYLPVMS